MLTRARFYFVHAGTKHRFMTKKGHQNRGFRDLHATIFCNHLAKAYAPQTKIFENRKTFPTVVLSTFQVTVAKIYYTNPSKSAQNDGRKCFIRDFIKGYES
jgi:hypothetical protein